MACKYYINNKVLTEQEIKEYIGSSYIKESDIKLTTLGDIADLLAYSNSKLILPGNEVVYTTPDNQQFKTYAEASKHISDLAKSVEDVDLTKPLEKYAVHFSYMARESDGGYDEQPQIEYFNSLKEAEEYSKRIPDSLFDRIEKIENFLPKSFIEKNKEYEQSKEIIEEWKKVNNIQYNPEEVYSRGQEFVSVVGAYSEFDVNLMMQNLLSHIEDNEKANNHDKITSKDKIVFGHPGIGKTYLRESGRTDVIDFDSDYKTKINEKFNLPKGFKARNDFQKSNKEEYQKAVRELWIEAKQEAKSKGKQLFASDMILLREFANDFDKVITMSKDTFVNRAKQRNDYTQGETESWKNSLDTEINKLDKSKVINTTDYLSNLFSKGSGFAISAFTKPTDKKIGHLEGGGGKIKFKLYPQSNDILWAANTDVYSGSVWDASEKVNKDKKSELLGVSYTKYPSLSNVTTVQPNLADIVDNLAHHHNELGIVLTGNNFRLEYDDDIPYSTKKIIDSINSILDQKYGKLVKPKIDRLEKNDFRYTVEWNDIQNPNEKFHFKTEKEAIDYATKLNTENGNTKTEKDIEDYGGYVVRFTTHKQGIQPTQIKENTTSIDSVKSKYNLLDTEYGTLDLNAEELISAEDYLDSLKTATIILNDSSVNNEYVNANKWFINIEGNYPNGNFNTKKEAEDYLKEEIQKAQNALNKLKSKPKKEYTSQALINTKIAKLKEVAKKYPRSLIRSEVKRINTSSSQELYDQFGADELPFQKLSKSPKEVLQEKLNEQVKNNKQVVFDTTNLTKDKRLPFIEAIKKAIPNANIQYELMELNPELAKQRIKAQLARGENRAAVSDATIDRHAESYKQMLEDIKSEPITKYKELGSKQDIEGFKKFTKRQSNDINNQENNNIEQSQINENNTESFTKESLNKKIDELLKSGEIYYTDDDSKPCAANGLRNTVKGTDWKIATEFKGKSHAQGGIDITLNENGYHFRRGGKDIKAANGLIIENK